MFSARKLIGQVNHSWSEQLNSTYNFIYNNKLSKILNCSFHDIISIVIPPDVSPSFLLLFLLSCLFLFHGIHAILIRENMVNYDHAAHSTPTLIAYNFILYCNERTQKSQLYEATIRSTLKNLVLKFIQCFFCC